jgi:hypothetical protein
LILQRKRPGTAAVQPRVVAPNFADLVDLEAKIMALLAKWNQAALPFNWTSASFYKVLAKVDAALKAAAWNRRRPTRGADGQLLASDCAQQLSCLRF